MTITNETTQIPVRLAFDSFAAGYSRAMAHLDQAATKELDKAEIDPKLRELIRIRASQLNGCAYCIDMHTKDARAIGETEQRIYGLAAWRSPSPSRACPTRTSPTRRTRTWPRSSARSRSPRWSASS
jgi:AhpD family alkylhydroperoxidase